MRCDLRVVHSKKIIEQNDFKKLHTEYKELTEKKDKLYQEYGKLKKKVKQYDTIKQNVDSILRQAKQPEQDKGTQR